MTTLYQDAPVRADGPVQAEVDTDMVVPASDTIDPREALDASRDVLLAVQRALVANWENAHPRIAVVKRNGIDTVYVSTATRLAPQIRADIRGAVRTAHASYARLAPFTNVVFLTRG
jgi:hypothetical protein